MLSYLLELLESALTFTDSKCSIHIWWVLCDIFLNTLVQPLNTHSNELLLYVKCFPLYINWITCHNTHIMFYFVSPLSRWMPSPIPSNGPETVSLSLQAALHKKCQRLGGSQTTVHNAEDSSPRSRCHRGGVLVKNTNLIQEGSILMT